MKSEPKDGFDPGEFSESEQTETRAELDVQEEDRSYAATRVLLADDHSLMREGLARLLGQEPDIEIVGQAADGLKAVELAGKLAPDVILMDVSMPKMGGIESTRIIHRQMPQIKIIGLSMFEETQKAETLMEAGAVAYLTKSGLSRDIINTIRTCMTRNEPKIAYKMKAAAGRSFTTIHDPEKCPACKSLVSLHEATSRD